MELDKFQNASSEEARAGLDQAEALSTKDATESSTARFQQLRTTIVSFQASALK